MKRILCLLLASCSSPDFGGATDLANDLFPVANLCDYGRFREVTLSFEEINCGPLAGREESSPGSGVDFCDVDVDLSELLPGLVAHVSCDVERSECHGIADTPSGCMWEVSWS